MIASLAVDTGVVWLVAAFLSWDTDPISTVSRLLWLIGMVLLAAVAAVIGYRLVADAASALRVVAAVAAAGLAVALAVVAAGGTDPGWRAVLTEGIVLTLLGVVGLAVAVATRRRSLV